MSQVNIEAFKRTVEAYNQNDVDALLDGLDPDVEWRPVLPVVLGGTTTVYRGHAGIREMLRDLDEVLGERQLAFSEIHDGGDCVVAVGRLTIRGRESGLRTESAFAWVGHFKRGKASSIRTYLNPEEALETAGLEAGQP